MTMNNIPLIAYFAAHAPEVPSWFVLQDEQPLPPHVDLLEIMQADPRHGQLSGEDQRTLEAYYRDPITVGVLPATARPIWDAAYAAIDRSNAERDAIRSQNQAKRFYTWRWSYAQNMAGTAEQFGGKAA